MQAAVATPQFQLRSPKRQALAVLPLMSLGALHADQSFGEFMGWCSIGLVLGIVWIVGVWLTMQRMSLRMTPQGVEFHGLVRTRHLAPAGTALEAVRIRRSDSDGWWQVWRGQGGAVVLIEEVWGRDQLESLASAAAAHRVELPIALTRLELGKRYPEAFSGLTRDPRVIAWGLPVAFFVCAAVYSFWP